MHLINVTMPSFIKKYMNGIQQHFKICTLSKMHSNGVLYSYHI
jgi:hypothetical protein